MWIFNVVAALMLFLIWQFFWLVVVPTELGSPTAHLHLEFNILYIELLPVSWWNNSDTSVNFTPSSLPQKNCTCQLAWRFRILQPCVKLYLNSFIKQFSWDDMWFSCDLEIVIMSSIENLNENILTLSKDIKPCCIITPAWHWNYNFRQAAEC